jgi:hypothetical protein
MYNNHPVNPHSIARILAYVHRYEPKFISGRLMPPKDLRQLAAWIHFPMPEMLTVRQNRILAAHLILLNAAELITTNTEGTWQCTATAFTWLKWDYSAQIELILDTVKQEGVFQQNCTLLNLNQIYSIDFESYLAQALQRYLDSIQHEKVVKQNRSHFLIDGERIIITIRNELKPSLAFDFLQFGDWTPKLKLVLTPATMIKAVKRGYSLPVINTILAQVSNGQLPENIQLMITQWISREGAYRLENACVLSTKQSGYLAEILANRRLAKFVHEQLSPRHALVSNQIEKPLTHWLNKKGFLLENQTSTNPNSVQSDYWEALAVTVLAELAHIIPLPVTLPANRLVQLQSQLPPDIQTAVRVWADEIIDGLHQAIRGKDAFFLPEQPVSENLLTMIKNAIEENQVMAVFYQSPADKEPRYRQIQPLRLETQRLSVSFFALF